MKKILASVLLLIAAISIIRLLNELFVGGLDQEMYGKQLSDWLSSRSP